MLIAYEMGGHYGRKRIRQTYQHGEERPGIHGGQALGAVQYQPTYLRQIEGGTKVPSLPVFINICNALKISPDYLLRDALEDNEVSKIRELAELWESTSPSQQEIAVAMIRAVLEHKEG